MGAIGPIDLSRKHQLHPLSLTRKNPPKGEFCSKYKEIYSSPPIIFDTTESFTESCKQTLFTALSKRLSCVK